MKINGRVAVLEDYIKIDKLNKKKFNEWYKNNDITFSSHLEANDFASDKRFNKKNVVIHIKTEDDVNEYDHKYNINIVSEKEGEYGAKILKALLQKIKAMEPEEFVEWFERDNNKPFYPLRTIIKICDHRIDNVILSSAGEDLDNAVYCNHKGNEKHYCSSFNCPILKGLEERR